VLHWLRNKLPVFRNIGEIKTFTLMYFKVTDLKLGDYVESAKMKVEGDEMLKSNLELKEGDIESNRFNHTVDSYKAPCTNSELRKR
jgi:hypothetical protein